MFVAARSLSTEEWKIEFVQDVAHDNTDMAWHAVKHLPDK
jgi:hypothetical protein